MAGGAAQRRSARKRATTTRYSDAGNANQSSPTQATKKRKTNARTRKTPRHEDQDDETENESNSDTEAPNDTAELTQIADKVIPFLKEANYAVQVLSQYPARPEDEAVRAFAKIAGLGWTYYVTSASINIGRAPSERQSGFEDQEPGIHIDLGPSKTVSRLHASITYHPEDERWHIAVSSRNGARVNEVLLRKADERAIKSGDVIEIAGTEMIFISPNERAKVEQIYIDRMTELPPSKTDSLKVPQSGNFEHQTVAKYEAPMHISPYAQPGEQSVPAPDEASAPRPSTPINSIMSAPYLNQSVGNPQFEHMNTMESSEHIDYASDHAKDVKPPMSYSTLIAQAILSTPEEKLSLNGIYEWIKTNFSYYRHIEQSWQNSIRHNLSLSAAFAKKAREAHEPGKGGLWYIVEDKKEAFKKEGLKTTSRGGARQSSNPNSPAPNRRSPKKDLPLTMSDSNQVGLTSTPPAAARRATETPSKPSITVSGFEMQELPQLSQNSPPFVSQHGAATGSPTGIRATVYLAEPTANYSFQTPAPQRAEPRFNIPSTAKLPSQWLPQSSPNPWHIDINNKPFPFDSSPIKGKSDAPTGGLRSSSPPPAIAEGSPTRPKASPFTPQLNGVIAKPPEIVRPEPTKHDEDDMPIDLMGGSFTAIGASATG